MQIDEVDERKLVELGRIIDGLNPPKSFNLDGLRVAVNGFHGETANNCHFKLLIGPNEETADIFLSEFLEDMDKDGVGSVLKARLLSQTKEGFIEIGHVMINNKNIKEGEIPVIKGHNLPIEAFVVRRNKKEGSLEYQIIFAQEEEINPREDRWKTKTDGDSRLISESYKTNGLKAGTYKVFLFVRVAGAEPVKKEGKIRLIDEAEMKQPRPRKGQQRFDFKWPKPRKGIEPFKFDQ